MLLFVMDLAAADHRLATWEDLLDELTPRQVRTLMAYARIRGFGEDREDMRQAKMATILGSAFGGKPKLGELYEFISPKEHDSELSPDQAAKMFAKRS